MTESPTPIPFETREEVVIVLAAIDTSALASRVVELAAHVARRTWNNVELHLVHVFRSAPFVRRNGPAPRCRDERASPSGRRPSCSGRQGHLLVGVIGSSGTTRASGKGLRARFSPQVGGRR